MMFLQKWYRNIATDLEYKDFDVLMAPDEVGKWKKGSCHDQARFLAWRAREMGYASFVCFFIDTIGITHSCCIIAYEGKVWWLESAWQDNRGMRRYNSLQDFYNDVSFRWGYPLKKGYLSLHKMQTGMNLQELIDIVEWCNEESTVIEI